MWRCPSISCSWKPRTAPSALAAGSTVAACRPSGAAVTCTRVAGDQGDGDAVGDDPDDPSTGPASGGDALSGPAGWAVAAGIACATRPVRTTAPQPLSSSCATFCPPGCGRPGRDQGAVSGSCRSFMERDKGYAGRKSVAAGLASGLDPAGAAHAGTARPQRRGTDRLPRPAGARPAGDGGSPRLRVRCRRRARVPPDIVEKVLDALEHRGLADRMPGSRRRPASVDPALAFAGTLAVRERDLQRSRAWSTELALKPPTPPHAVSPATSSRSSPAARRPRAGWSTSTAAPPRWCSRRGASAVRCRQQPSRTPSRPELLRSGVPYRVLYEQSAVDLQGGWPTCSAASRPARRLGPRPRCRPGCCSSTTGTPWSRPRPASR